MFRFSIKSALVACGAVCAVGIAGCSGSRSVLPGMSTQTLDALRSSHAGRFTIVKAQPPVAMQMAFLMTDGSVLTQSGRSWSQWYRYTPDAQGSYADGTWTQVGSLQSGYAPDAYASDVLADGRLVISGGEYNAGGNYQLQLVNLGAVYDPTTATWSPLGHPKGWKFIGDSPSSVLPNGRLLLGDKLHVWDASLDPTSLHWRTVKHTGKSDFNSEEGWTLLANGTILTADVKNAPNSEIYNPANGKWKSAGSTIVDLHSPRLITPVCHTGPSRRTAIFRLERSARRFCGPMVGFLHRFFHHGLRSRAHRDLLLDREQGRHVGNRTEFPKRRQRRR